MIEPRTDDLDRMELISDFFRGTYDAPVKLEPLTPQNLLALQLRARQAVMTEESEVLADFYATAPNELIRLVDTVFALRGALQDIADDLHAPDCERVDRPDLGCDCHSIYAQETLAEL